jgi:hypothetical protein
VVKETAQSSTRTINQADQLHQSPDLDAVERVPFSILFAGVRDDYRLEDLPNLGARAHNALRRHDAMVFADIKTWTVESLSQRWNVGSTTVNEIIAALGTISRIGESDLVTSSPELPSDADPENITAREALHAWWQVTRALRVIAGWSAENLGPQHSLGHTLERIKEMSGVPLLVRESVDILHKTPVTVLAPEAAPNTVEAELRAWIQTLDTREFQVLTQRLLASEPTTLAVLGEELKLSRERIRQIEDLLKAKAKLLFNPDWKALAGLFHELKSAIGVLAPLDMVPEPAINLTDLLPQLSIPTLEVLVRLSGEGQISHGFIGFPELTSLRVASLNLITDCVADGPVETNELITALTGLGIPAYAAGLWLNTFELAHVGDKLSSTPKTIADKALLVLKTTGKPHSLDQLVVALDEAHTAAAIRNALTVDDRFSKLGIKMWALRDMNAAPEEEFLGLKNAMTKAVREAGGSMALKDLAALMATKHGASKGSVRVYAGQRPFTFDNGIVSLTK